MTPPSEPPVAIRTAGEADAALLHRFGAATFTQAFAAQNRPEDMAAYLAAVFSPARQSAELRDPASFFLIAAIADAPAGYAHLSVSKPPDCATAESPVELVRFYVDAAWHGRGVSHALMREALMQAARRGHDRIWLGVWEKNLRAIRFYEKWGFAAIGSKEFLLGSDLQTDLVMIRATT
jgi:GNAT superfamily N-acetyltransferase